MTLERDILNTCQNISRELSDLPKRAEVESMITSCLLTAKLETIKEINEHQKNCMIAGHFSELMTTINEVKTLRRAKLSGKQIFAIVTGVITVLGGVFGVAIKF